MTKHTRALLACLLLAALTAVVAAGCGGSGVAAAGEEVEVLKPAAAIVDAIPSLAEPDEPQPDTFVGKASDGQHFVAVVRRGNDAVVYVCDGAEIGDWLGASVSDGHISGSSDDGTSIDAELAGAEISGTITPAGGEQLEFTAASAEPGSGLFREADLGPDNAVLGWIVANDGAIRGLIDGGKKGVGAPLATDPLDDGGVVDEGPSAPSEPAPAGEDESGGSGGGSSLECKNVIPHGCSIPCNHLEAMRTVNLEGGGSSHFVNSILQAYNAQLSQNLCPGHTANSHGFEEPAP